jgi:hypothetical protein
MAQHNTTTIAIIQIIQTLGTPDGIFAVKYNVSFASSVPTSRKARLRALEKILKDLL